METIILNLSGVYPQEDFYTKIDNSKLIDLTHIQGTNCYCDDDAALEIKSIIENEPLNAIHFFDSGNFHYISKLWTDKIEQPFNLLVFDHHNDMQQPSFGDILSCGGWILKAIEENKFLNKVILIGVRDDLALQIPCHGDKVICFKESDNLKALTILKGLTVLQQLPIYISIDKDAFSEEYTITNWDQGSLSVDSFTDIVNHLKSTTNILGYDVCGEPDNENISNYTLAINSSFNQQIINIIKEKGS